MEALVVIQIKQRFFQNSILFSSQQHCNLHPLVLVGCSLLRGYFVLDSKKKELFLFNHPTLDNEFYSECEACKFALFLAMELVTNNEDLEQPKIGYKEDNLGSLMPLLKTIVRKGF